MRLRLVRVEYGKKSTPKHLREYRIDGRGPVGTLAEYKEHFPGHEFIIEDKADYGGFGSGESDLNRMLFGGKRR